MPTENSHMPDKELLKRFIDSDQGKKLLGQLNRSDPETIRAAADKAAAGDISGALAVLRTLFASEDDHGKKEAPHGK